MKEFKRNLMEDFEIKDSGVARHCLGLEMIKKKDAITLIQKGYTLYVLARYGIENCNHITTPSELHPKDGLEGSAKSEAGPWPYRKLIGALMYLAVATKPDIAKTVSRLAQFNNKPKEQHWLSKRVLRYLAATMDIGLLFSRTGQPLIGYSDADWGGCTVDIPVVVLAGAAGIL